MTRTRVSVLPPSLPSYGTRADAGLSLIFHLINEGDFRIYDIAKKFYKIATTNKKYGRCFLSWKMLEPRAVKWGAGGFPKSREGRTTSEHPPSAPKAAPSRLPTTSHFAASLSHFCSRARFRAHPLKFSNYASSTLEKSPGSTKMSQMSKVKDSRASNSESPSQFC